MFGLGMGELLVLLVVALLFLGPEKLPDAAKAISKGIRDLRRHTRDLQATLEEDTQIGDAYRDLRSALRGDDLRFQPKPKPPAPDAAPPGQAQADPALGGVTAGDIPPPRTPLEPSETAPAPSPAAPQAPPTPTSAAAEDGEAAGPDDDLPQVRPAAGAVSRSRLRVVGGDDDPGEAHG